MRRALLLTPLWIALLAALAASCGGSSSETPWPVEPDPSVMGPRGESATPVVIEEDAGKGAAQKKP
jgi:hypothetical protein